MKPTLSARLALVLAVLPLAAHALTPSQVFEQVKDSVVVIKTLDAEGTATTQGSGVLLPSGKIATNCHVVKDGVRFVGVTVWNG
jgi:S1-C subfamily serine protease